MPNTPAITIPPYNSTGEHRATPPVPPPPLIPDTLTAHIQQLVAQASPLTDTQRTALRAILQPRKPRTTRH